MNRAEHPGRLTLLVLALLLAAHSAAHLVAAAHVVGTMGSGRGVQLFGGLVTTSNWAFELALATALAVAGTGFLIAARLLAGAEPAVGPVLVVVAGLSLVLTVAGTWATVGGVPVNVVVLAFAPGISRLVNDRRAPRSVFF